MYTTPRTAPAPRTMIQAFLKDLLVIVLIHQPESYST